MRWKVFFSSQGEKPKVLLESVFRQICDGREAIQVEAIEKKQVENWQSNWQRFFKPQMVGSQFVIRPPWEPPQPHKKEIVIQPGLGFGTGYHESTQLALEMLEWITQQTTLGSVIDVGTGSGILAIGSLLLGATWVTAIDTDAASLTEVPRNLVLSGLKKKFCQVLQQQPADLDQTADLVVANIVAETILALSDHLNRLTAPSGFLIISGILAEYRCEIEKRFELSMALMNTLQREEWYSFAFQKF